MITVVGLPYFRGVIAQGDVRAEGWWGTALALAQLIVMGLAPMVGVFADVKAAKKRLLLAAAVICAAATAGLFWTGAGVVWPALGLTALALAGEWLALRRPAQRLTEQRCDDAADDVSVERHHP